MAITVPNSSSTYTFSGDVNVGGDLGVTGELSKFKVKITAKTQGRFSLPMARVLFLLLSLLRLMVCFIYS